MTTDDGPRQPHRQLLRPVSARGRGCGAGWQPAFVLLRDLDGPRRTVEQLRAWESRHGFPRPERLPNGHRRYQARTSAATLVFADFSARGSAPGPPGPYEVALPPDATLRREWFVACDGDGCAAALAGWELPAAGGPAGRWFGATWTAEPATVAQVSAIVLRLGARTLPPSTSPSRTRRPGPWTLGSQHGRRRPSPSASSATSTSERPRARLWGIAGNRSSPPTTGSLLLKTQA
jgi:hypothetical protein